MSTIRCIYAEEPSFPATDQHPDAVRYHVGDWWVDSIGGMPTEAEIDKLINHPTLRENIQAALVGIDQLTLSKGVRGLREFILMQARLTDAIITQGLVNGVQPTDTISQNPGIVNVYLLEQQAIALRAQLAQLPPE